jgi:eukaryotic-like serine/threonine-protein kinase
MDDDRWNHVDELLQSAFDIPAVERDAYLRHACGGDQRLEEEVRSLLAAHDRADGFLGAPAIDLAARELAGERSDDGGQAGGDPLIGQTLSHYRIVEKLGGGGMGVVYKAEDSRLHRPVALKFVSEDLASDAEALSRFQREARTASALNHPHICTIYDIGEQDGRSFIAMEYLEGTTLKGRLGAGALSLKAALHVGAQLATALDAAHSAGIIHRDIKPENIFVGPRDHVKVLDFGLAKSAPTTPQADLTTTAGTRQGVVMGTAAYMAPEQARGEAVDHRADIWSFGLVLYEMVKGVRPPQAVRLRVEASPELERIVSKCLETERELRYQHAADLCTDLERLRRGQSATVAPEAAPGRRRARWLSIGAAAVVVIAAAAGVIDSRRAALALTDKETVVLADFANNTGDPVFDGTLRQGLAIQLQQSTFLSLTSDTRIQELLRLMGQPADAALTPAIARDICERMGGGAIVEGRISALGAQYVLGVRASGCRSGRVLGQEQEQVATKEDVLTALSGIASRLRVQLGESLSTLDEHNRPLPDVSTASLEALKAYSAGSQAQLTQGSQGRPAVIELLKRAVEIDDGFAMAHARLGTSYSTGGELVLGARHTTRAFELRERATDNEKFYITATYHRQVTGDLDQALRAFDLWAQTYPRTFDSYGLASGFVTKGQGRYEGCIERAGKAEAANPESPFGYLNAAACYMYIDRLDDAAAALQRAADRKLYDARWRFHLAFLRGDDPAMEREFARAQGQAIEGDLTYLKALALARSGRLQLAGPLARRGVDLTEKAGQPERAAVYQTAAAVWHALVGDVADARRIAALALKKSTGRDVTYAAAFALALTGDLSRSQVLLKDLEARFPEDTTVHISYLPALRGLIALQQGTLAEALQKLEPALSNEFALPGTAFFASFGSLYPAYVRGQTYLAAKRPADAAVEFQKIISHRGLVMEDPIDAFARLQLARALVASGDTARARVAYEDFLTLWQQADADIPLLKQAQAEAAKLR